MYSVQSVLYKGHSRREGNAVQSEINRRFGEVYYFHSKGRKVKEETKVPLNVRKSVPPAYRRDTS